MNIDPPCHYCKRQKPLARRYSSGMTVCLDCVDKHNEESDRQYYQKVGEQMMAQSIGHLLISGEIDGTKAEMMAEVARSMKTESENDLQVAFKEFCKDQMNIRFPETNPQRKARKERMKQREQRKK